MLTQLKINMTQSEINKLHKSIATDFKIVARKTELWDILYCHQILHDIKKMMLFRYADTVSLIMNDNNNTPLKVKQYKIGYISRTQDDRPGGIDWEDGEGQNLFVVVIYTQEYQNLSVDQKNLFQREQLKLSWTATGVDVTFPHLSKILSKMYTHGGSGVDRVDFN